jgi:hypothetical protein
VAEVHPIPTDKRFIDITGKTFGLWFVESYAGRVNRGNTNRATMWNCRCTSCQRTFVVGGKALRTGRSTGCLECKVKTHGLSFKPEFVVWKTMIFRCHNPKSTEYHRYGSRGIIVCERWRESFENFIADMGERPSKGHSIDRIDNNGNYEPGNCRWATDKEQCNNRRDNRLITCDGKTKTMTAWSELTGIKIGTIWARLKSGWSEQDAVMLKVGSLPTKKEASLGLLSGCDDGNVNQQTDP